MRNELEDIQQIEKYLRDELSASERIAFEERLKIDKALEEEVELQKKVLKGIERIGVKKDIKKAEKSYFNQKRGMYFGLLLLLAVSVGLAVNYAVQSPKEVIEVEEILTSNTIETEDLVSDEIITEELVNSEGKVREGIGFAEIPQKEFQYFTINSSKDEVIKGKEGTIITIKANSFNVAANTLIKIRVKEYYKMSDIAFSNLTTETADGKLLETGGMIFIDAKAKGNELSLKENKSIELKFPFDKKKKDMILFDGKLKDKQVVWEEVELDNNSIDEIFEKEELVSANEIFTIVETMPEFPGGQTKLFEYLGKNVKYPKEALLNNESGTVYVNFTIGKDGVIRDERIVRGVSTLLDEEALRVVRSLPKWNPGMQRGERVSISYNLPIKFTMKGGVGYSSSDIKNYNDSLLASRLEDVKGGDRLSASGGNTVISQKQQITSDANYYVLSSSNLGYINCDRFVNRGRRITFKMDVGENNVQVKLIFKSIKGIMGDLSYKKAAYFNYVPEGMKVVAFAVKFIDNKPYVSFQEVNTSDKNVKLIFEELTIDKLKVYKEQLNSF